MKASDAAYTLIKEYEGYSKAAYPDPATGDEPWTIGWGTTMRPDGRRIRPGDVCTKEEAEEWLQVDVKERERLLDQALQVPVAQEMYDALISLLYNVGPGLPGKKDGIVWLKDGRPSTLLYKLNNSDYIGAAEEFDRWNRAADRVMAGLVRRRDAEQRLFTTGIENTLRWYEQHIASLT